MCNCSENSQQSKYRIIVPQKSLELAPGPRLKISLSPGITLRLWRGAGAGCDTCTQPPYHTGTSSRLLCGTGTGNDSCAVPVSFPASTLCWIFKPSMFQCEVVEAQKSSWFSGSQPPYYTKALSWQSSSMLGVGRGLEPSKQLAGSCLWCSKEVRSPNSFFWLPNPSHWSLLIVLPPWTSPTHVK